MSDQRQVIEIEVTSGCTFEVSDLWPDGDAPDEITEADVLELVKQCDPRRLIHEWFFPKPDIIINVRTAS